MEWWLAEGLIFFVNLFHIADSQKWYICEIKAEFKRRGRFTERAISEGPFSPGLLMAALNLL